MTENKQLDQALSSLDPQKAKVLNFGPTRPGEGNRFIDRTADYGLEGVEGVWFASVDLNRDQHPDLVVLPGYFHQPVFYLWSVAEHRFVLSSNPFFSEAVSASFMSFADFNRDGVIDVVVGVLNQRGEYSKLPLSLWHGSWDSKGLLHFTKAPFVKLPPEPTSSVVVVDVDLDGRLDLFVGNWYQEKKGASLPTSDRLLLNRVNGWEEHSDWLSSEGTKTSSQLYAPHSRPTYGASSCDIDDDGWPDILTASSGGYSNKLWMNRPPRPGPNAEGRRFEDMGQETLFASDAQGNLMPTGGGRTFTAVCADYNDDGLMDVFLGELTHGWDPNGVDRSSVLTGARLGFPPSFLRTEYMSDTNAENWNQGDKRALWADLNNDGLVDLLVDNSGFPPSSRLVAFRQDETRAFVNVAAEWGVDLVNPVGSVLVDLNQDGRLDIITGQNNVREASIKNRIWVLENGLVTDGRAVVFHLEGVLSNLEGLGAMVMLYTELKDGKKIVQRRWYERLQGGLASELPEGVHFGVDAGTKVIGVKVRWPALKKSGGRGGRMIEHMYPLSDHASEKRQVWTLCESGKSVTGRFRCNPI